jgi:hypothetical protein
MTIKVFTVLGFCLFLGLFFVGLEGWIDVFQRVPQIRQHADDRR